MMRLRWKRWVACTSLAVVALVLGAESTPFTWGEDVKPLRWPENKTINVYIETDTSAPPDRSALIKEGMERWQSVMSPRGITITVQVGAVPTPAPDNLVRVKYKPNGTKQDGSCVTLSDENHMCASCTGRTNKLVGGEVLVRDDLDASTDADKEQVRNLGQHELTHVLGLADDKDGTVTAHDQGTTPNTFNDTDTKEIDKLYPLPKQEEAKADGQTVPSSNPNDYSFDFNYTGPPNGHVSLITLDVHPVLIDTVTPPPGWIVLDPSDPGRVDLTHPYYQDYMVDGAPTEPPWDPSVTPPLSFRALGEIHTLSVANPTLTIGLTTNGAQRAPIQAWAGGELQTIIGPVLPGGGIPALPTWGLVLLAALLLGLGWRTIHSREGSVAG